MTQQDFDFHPPLSIDFSQFCQIDVAVIGKGSFASDWFRLTV
jgi:hypothetical protein